MAYRWRITFIIPLLFSHSPGVGGWPPLHFRALSSVPSLQTVDGSKVTFLACFIIPSPSLYRVPWSSTASPGPRIVLSLRAPLLGRLLRGAPLPVPSSLVFLPHNTRWSVLWLVRCSKVPVGGSFSGSRLDSPFSIFDSPLVGSVPSCCRCFTLSCLFCLLVMRYWLTLSTAYANVSHPSTSQHHRLYVLTDEICLRNSLPTVRIIVFY